MRFIQLITLAVISVACAANILPNNESDDEINLVTSNGAIQPYCLASWPVKHVVRKLAKQMPCGWPEYGIPPLAPLKKREFELNIQEGFLSSLTKLWRFRVDGLDNYNIELMKINPIKSKINFDFVFPLVNVSATSYETQNLFDALESLGVSVQYGSTGDVLVHVNNLRVAGVIKYKIPVLWGSTKITSWKTRVTMESSTAKISELLGDGSVNAFVNDIIGEELPVIVNESQDSTSDIIENWLVPKINKQLKGNDIWTIIDNIFGTNDAEDEDDNKSKAKCVPPSDPWA